MQSDVRCYLEGEWTVDHVKERSHHLRNHPLFALPEEQAGPATATRLVVDLERMTGIDAAGCQLITVWLSCLEFFGVTPALENASDALLDAMHRMGFEYAIKPYLGDR